MTRKRMKNYVDIGLKKDELKKLLKGYRLTKFLGGQYLSIFLVNKNRKDQKEITKLKARIKELEYKK